MRFIRVLKHKVRHTAPKTVPDGWKVWGLVDAPLENGVGRYLPQLKRLTLSFSKDREDSAGAREFVLSALGPFARAQPWTAVYALPLRRAAPKLIGEFLNGRTATAHIGHQSPAEIARWLAYFASRSGQRIAHFEVLGKSTAPSVQGMWDPFTHVPSRLNVADFPDEAASTHIPPNHSATQILQQLLKKSAAVS